ncbi:MAG: hypothetical protein IT544_03135 [Rhodobacteraceae bacterium]|nr:hypothetical protein [Paracoccaceae bacterium]
MIDLSQQEQFDLDRLAEDLGTLPEAPLVMPVQTLESPITQSFLALFRSRLAPLTKTEQYKP